MAAIRAMPVEEGEAAGALDVADLAAAAVGEDVDGPVLFDRAGLYDAGVDVSVLARRGGDAEGEIADQLAGAGE